MSGGRSWLPGRTQPRAATRPLKPPGRATDERARLERIETAAGLGRNNQPSPTKLKTRPTSDEMIDLYKSLVKKYPIIFLEDPLVGLSCKL